MSPKLPKHLRLPLIVVIALLFDVVSGLFSWWLLALARDTDAIRFKEALHTFEDTVNDDLSRYSKFAQEMVRATLNTNSPDIVAWRAAVQDNEWPASYPFMRAVAVIGPKDETMRSPLLWHTTVGEGLPSGLAPHDGWYPEFNPAIDAAMAAARAERDFQQIAMLEHGIAVLVNAKFRDKTHTDVRGYVFVWIDAEALRNKPLSPKVEGLIERRILAPGESIESTRFAKVSEIGRGGLILRNAVMAGPKVWEQSAQWVAWVVAACGFVIAVSFGVLQWRSVSTRMAEEAAAAAKISQLHASLDAEREVVRLKTSFVNTVSHEFRTPLGVILSSADLLDGYANRLTPERRSEHIQHIREASRRMAEMVEHILLLGRIESGRSSIGSTGFHAELFSLDELLQQMVDEQLSASHHRCTIQLEMDDSIRDAKVKTDASLLRHIFANLISNAVKYSPAGSIVTLAVQRSGNDAVFTVTDCGIGIPPEDIKRLGEAFRRGKNVENIPGTGLGWVIIKRCVDLHGGSADITSKPGAGTNVTVRLPLFYDAKQLPS